MFFVFRNQIEIRFRTRLTPVRVQYGYLKLDLYRAVEKLLNFILFTRNTSIGINCYILH